MVDGGCFYFLCFMVLLRSGTGNGKRDDIRSIVSFQGREGISSRTPLNSKLLISTTTIIHLDIMSH